MKGKIAFVLGAGLGYVLGSRAGRARYEQIKSGANALWNTKPVQRGVVEVKGFVGIKTQRVQDAVVDAGKVFVKSVMDFSKSEDARQARAAGSAAAGDSAAAGEAAAADGGAKQ